MINKDYVRNVKKDVKKNKKTIKKKLIITQNWIITAILIALTGYLHMFNIIKKDNTHCKYCNITDNITNNINDQKNHNIKTHNIKQIKEQWKYIKTLEQNKN